MPFPYAKRGLKINVAFVFTFTFTFLRPTLYKEAAKIKTVPSKMKADSVFLGAFRIVFKTFFDTRLRLFSDKT